VANEGEGEREVDQVGQEAPAAMSTPLDPCARIPLAANEGEAEDSPQLPCTPESSPRCAIIAQK
jgi:hypothetical protein